MPQTLKATYSNGAFILQTTCDIPLCSEVELFVKYSNIVAPPIPSDAEPFTRDMLHERR